MSVYLNAIGLLSAMSQVCCSPFLYFAIYRGKQGAKEIYSWRKMWETHLTWVSGLDYLQTQKEFCKPFSERQGSVKAKRISNFYFVIWNKTVICAYALLIYTLTLWLFTFVGIFHLSRR